MSYKALYLTYRPQTFDEVAGQKPIVRTLTNALASDKIAHAYLFAGPRGTGKTTMARLFAKALDCEEGIGHQCNKCSNCQAITDGNHPDVIEIDAASNNGVDQVRDLIEKVKYAPIKGRYKVYIIDEIHMMSTGAFNALLKTLEEPPDNVIFILCTTEPYKVIPTILSRCQRFDFTKLSDEEMEGKLKEVLIAEKTDYDENGLKAIIKLADGGMRDALSILDQVLAYSNNKLREDAVLTIFGLASEDEKIDLLNAIKEGDVTRVVGKSEAYLAGGLDVRRLVAELISILKDLLIFEKTSDATLLEEVTVNEASSLAKILSTKDCDEMITSLIDAQNDFRNVSDVRSLFELTLLRMAARSDASNPTAQIAEEPKPLPKKEAVPEPIKVVQPLPQAAPKPVLITANLKKDVPAPTPTPIAVKQVQVAPAPEPIKAETPPDFLFEEEKTSEEAKPAPILPKKSSKAKDKEPIKEVAAPITAPTSAIPAPTSAPAEATVLVPPSVTLNTSSVTKPAIATGGDQYDLPDDEIVKIMVLADKNERIALVDKWNAFEPLKVDPKLGNLATLLAEGNPFCLCKDAIILSYNFTRRKNEANIEANQEPLEQLLATVLGRKVFIYAIDPTDRNRITTAFFNLQEVNKLPARADIQLNLPK
jgi:DNA polymerase-3 subunit gamma/tau